MTHWRTLINAMFMAKPLRDRHLGAPEAEGQSLAPGEPADRGQCRSGR